LGQATNQALRGVNGSAILLQFGLMFWKIRNQATAFLEPLRKPPFDLQIETGWKNAVDSTKWCKESREEIKVKKRCCWDEFLNTQH